MEAKKTAKKATPSVVYRVAVEPPQLLQRPLSPPRGTAPTRCLKSTCLRPAAAAPRAHERSPSSGREWGPAAPLKAAPPPLAPPRPRCQGWPAARSPAAPRPPRARRPGGGAPRRARLGAPPAAALGQPRAVTRPAPPRAAGGAGRARRRGRGRGRAGRRLQLRRQLWRRRRRPRSGTRGIGKTSRASSPPRGAVPRPPATKAAGAVGIWGRSCPSASSPRRPGLAAAARAAFRCGPSRSRAPCRTTSECGPRGGRQGGGGGRQGEGAAAAAAIGPPAAEAWPGRRGQAGRGAGAARARRLASPALRRRWPCEGGGPGLPLAESQQGLWAAGVEAFPRPRDCSWEPPGPGPEAGAGVPVQPARRTSRFDVEPSGLVSLTAGEVREHPGASYLRGKRSSCSEMQSDRGWYFFSVSQNARCFGV